MIRKKGINEKDHINQLERNKIMFFTLHNPFSSPLHSKLLLYITKCDLRDLLSIFRWNKSMGIREYHVYIPWIFIIDQDPLASRHYSSFSIQSIQFGLEMGIYMLELSHRICSASYLSFSQFHFLLFAINNDEDIIYMKTIITMKTSEVNRKYTQTTHLMLDIRKATQYNYKEK